MNPLHPGVRIGTFGAAAAICWKQVVLLADGETQICEYLKGLPPVTEDSMYLPTLLDRFLGHNGHGKISCGHFMWTSYWDSIIILGAVRDTAICLPFDTALTSTLTKEGLAGFRREYEFILSELVDVPEQDIHWHDQIVFPAIEETPIPEIRWVEGKH